MYSYVCKPCSRPYDYKTIPEMLQHWARQLPEKEAFVYYDMDTKRHAITCSELNEKAGILAAFLKTISVKKKDVIGICMNNSIDMVIAQMGICLTGAIPMAVSKNMADGSDVKAAMLDLDAFVLILDVNVMEINQMNMNSLLHQDHSCLRHIIYSGQRESLDYPFVTFMEDIIENKTAPAAHKDQLPAVYPEDIAVYYRTSGTTGKPKTNGQNHFTIINNTNDLNSILGISWGSIHFCDRPLAWGAGSARTFIASGATRILLHPKLTTSGSHTDIVCDIIEKERCTHVYLPGYLARDVLDRPDLAAKFATVEKIICSGERVPATHSRLLNGYCKALLIWYGSTEVSGASVFMSSDQRMFEDGLIGTPQSDECCVEMKLVNEKGEVVLRGETGELLVRSVYRCSEFRGMPEKFSEMVDNNNWVRTGDLAYIRPDGNFVMKARTNDLISMGSMKYFPCEVENVLVSCPGVQAVVVVPVPDIRLNEVICACVVPKKLADLNIDILKKFCDETWIEEATATGFSLKPRYFVILEKIPVNASGKVDRKQLKKDAVALLGL